MVSLSDLSGTVGKFAPALGAAISASNPIAGIVVSMIAQIFGANKKDPGDILNRINQDPEAALKLKKIEYEHQESLANSEVQDRDSARNREIELAKITGKRDYIEQSIAILVVIGFFIICALLIFNPATIQDKSIITTPLIAAFMIVIHYYF